MQTLRGRAALLVSECGQLSEGEAVEHLTAALRAAETRGRRAERRYAGKAVDGVSAVRDIQARFLRAATVLRGSDPTAASALEDYAWRITNEWGYRP